MGIISEENQSNQSSVNWAIVMSVIYVGHSLAYCSLGRNEAGISIALNERQACSLFNSP